MKQILVLLLIACLAFSAQSQTVSDAVKLSYLEPGGTARFLGAGSAFSALGADYGVLSTNPAGLAMFRTNELVLTPALRFSNTDAQLEGSDNFEWEDTKSNFGFSNLGMIFNSNPTASRWTTVNFGIGFNRQQNFHQSIYYEGTAGGSIMNGWFAEADQVLGGGGSEQDLYPFGPGLAFDANAIYYQNGVLSYDFENTPNAQVTRNHSVITTGGINEMVVSVAGNYDEKLLIGATVGVPFIRYRLDGIYEEIDQAGTVDFFNNLTYTDFLRTSGVGVNFKMGVILKLNRMLQLGGSFHTPTFMSLTDRFSNTLDYSYTDQSGTFVNNSISPDGSNDYRFRSPWRASAGASVIMGRSGFLSADVEWVDYSAARYNFTSNINSSENERFERELNQEIQRELNMAVNFRVGGEIALDVFRLRAGFNLLGQPYDNDTGYNTAFTAGAGVYLRGFNLNFGYRRTMNEGNVSPYTGAPTALINTNVSDFLLTLGFKF